MAWKVGKQQQLNNSLEITTWRQVLQKETKFMKNKTIKELEELKGELERKNAYMHLFKSDGTLKKETIRETQGKNQIYIYDQVMKDTEVAGYCQKAKRERMWCKEVRPRETPKDIQNAPLTAAQVYGWREPIDNMQTGFNRSAVCVRTFHDKGHL